MEAVQSSIVIDMLGLWTLDYKKLWAWQSSLDFPEHEYLELKASGVTVIHPAVGFVKEGIANSSWNDLSRWNQLLQAHPDKFVKVLQTSDLELAKSSGRIGVVLGLQNSAHFLNVNDVDRYYELGQRVSQLTYFNNHLGGGSTDPSCKLTAYGADVVARMNTLGMAVDLSHCSDRTTLDAIEASTKRALITHSNCRSLVPGSGRCKTDEAIRKLAAKGGVFGVTMVRQFVRSSGGASLENMLDHIDRVVRLTGVEHVGLGTDVDLVGRDAGVPRKYDLDGVRYSEKIFVVAEGLFARGYSKSDVALILGENFQRVLGEIWSAS
ncbi:MAG: membrane dipeptidase [Bryobacteraceae bacterium]